LYFLLNPKLLRIKIAIFFSALFISVLTAPALITISDASQEIAFLLDINEEEEENKGKEESKVDSKPKICPHHCTSSILYCSFKIRKNIRFHSKNYTSKYPKVTTPPPKVLL
jgi:hypothetical protein